MKLVFIALSIIAIINENYAQDYKCEYSIASKFYKYLPINNINFEFESGNVQSYIDSTIFCIKHDSSIKCPYYVLKYKIKNNHIVDSLIDLIAKKTVFCSTNNDSLFYTIYQFQNRGTKAKLICVEDLKKKENVNKFPIVDFSNYNYNNELYLPNDYTVYLLMYQKGQILPFDVSPCYILPKEMGNGFSVGVAISKIKLEAIYWLIFW